MDVHTRPADKNLKICLKNVNVTFQKLLVAGENDLFN